MASSSQLPRIYGDRSNDLLESDFSKTSFKVQDFVAALSEKLVVNSTEDTGREPLACSDCQAMLLTTLIYSLRPKAIHQNL